jgi:hypothetical protein
MLKDISPTGLERKLAEVEKLGNISGYPSDQM